MRDRAWETSNQLWLPHVACSTAPSDWRFGWRVRGRCYLTAERRLREAQLGHGGGRKAGRDTWVLKRAAEVKSGLRLTAYTAACPTWGTWWTLFNT